MNRPSRILILGASYGSLLGIKLVMAGHRVTLVCLPNEVELINREGIRVRLPLKGREGLVELSSQDGSGRLRAAALVAFLGTLAGGDEVELAQKRPHQFLRHLQRGRQRRVPLQGPGRRQAMRRLFTLVRLIWSSGAYFVLPGSPL